MEKKLHLQFMTAHIRGEWFWPTREMNKIMRKLHPLPVRIPKPMLGNPNKVLPTEEAKRIGSKGGKVKGASASIIRDALMEPAIVTRILQAPELTWARRVEILGGKPFSEATLRRRYLRRVSK